MQTVIYNMYYHNVIEEMHIRSYDHALIKYFDCFKS